MVGGSGRGGMVATLLWMVGHAILFGVGIKSAFRRGLRARIIQRLHFQESFWIGYTIRSLWLWLRGAVRLGRVHCLSTTLGIFPVSWTPTSLEHAELGFFLAASGLRVSDLDFGYEVLFA